MEIGLLGSEKSIEHLTSMMSKASVELRFGKMFSFRDILLEWRIAGKRKPRAREGLFVIDKRKLVTAGKRNLTAI